MIMPSHATTDTTRVNEEGPRYLAKPAKDRTSWLRRQWWSAVEVLRWRGPLRFLFLVVREIFRPVVYWHVFYIIQNDLRQSLPTSYARAPFEVRIYAGEKDLETAKTDLSAIGVGEGTLVDIGERFTRGDVVAVAYTGTEAVGYSWMCVSSGLVLAFDATWIVQPDEAVLYDSFVRPQWRGRGIHSCLDVAINTYASQRGIVRTLGSMAIFNNQTLALAKRSGKPRIMTVILVRLRGKRRTWGTAIGAPLSSHFQLGGDGSSFNRSSE
jgi:GNAT superfamily N-acetyltransferase